MQSDLYDAIHQTEADHWWYVGRRHIVESVVRPLLEARPAARVLDLGCGTGYNLQWLAASGAERPVGADISSDALRYSRDRAPGRLVQSDAAKPPFAAASFDLVLALDLIEHLEDDNEALGQIARILRPGGHLVVFTPAFRFLWSVQDRVSHHFRRYTRSELEHKLRRAGFGIEKLTYANTLLFPLVFGGRLAIKLTGRSKTINNENSLHPSWLNPALSRVFSSERALLGVMNLPFGVSLLAVGRRP